MPEPAVRTFALPAPATDQPAREPHLAIDPSDGRRLIVAAQYGEGYNRGGRGIWSWVSADGGRVWAGRNIPLPRQDASLAADAVTGFGADGRGLLLFVYADSLFRGGAALTRTGPDDLDFGPTSIAVRGDIATNGVVDKPWFTVDRGRLSPFTGTVYLSYHHIRPGPDSSALPALWFRRGGEQWSDPVRVSDHFGGELSVRADGALDITFVTADERTLLHVASDDGGRTFTRPDTVTTVAPGIRIDGTTMTALAGDTLIVCWAADAAAPHDDLGGRCARGTGNADWSAPSAVEVAGRRLWFPVVARVGATAWLAGYTADSTTTRVELLRSTDGGRSFTPHHTLASRTFGAARFCQAPGAVCRRDRTTFFPGDYFAIATGRDQAGVAFTLPVTDEPTSRPTIYVSLVRTR